MNAEIQAGDMIVSNSTMLAAGDTVCILGVGFHRSIDWLPRPIKSAVAKCARKIGIDLYVLRNRGKVNISAVNHPSRTITIE